MSQAKVDRYKEEKRNREKIIKREKRRAAAMKAGASVVAIALVAWLGVSAYNEFKPEPAAVEKETYTVNTQALDDYVAGLSEE